MELDSGKGYDWNDAKCEKRKNFICGPKNIIIKGNNTSNDFNNKNINIMLHVENLT